jgi:hypothetical protein
MQALPKTVQKDAKGTPVWNDGRAH